MDRTEIPPGNIKHRWTKLAGPQNIACTTADITNQVASKMDALKRRALILRALELAEGKDPIDDMEFSDTMQGLHNMLQIQKQTASQQLEEYQEPDSDTLAIPREPISLACPPRPKRSGRPRDTSLKSWNKHAKKSKQSSSTKEDKEQEIITTEDGTPCLKTRRVSDLIQVIL